MRATGRARSAGRRLAGLSRGAGLFAVDEEQTAMDRSPALSRPPLPAEGSLLAPATDSLPAASSVASGLGEPTPRLGAGFLLAWVTAGLLTAVILKRRGHEFRSAAALGLVFGPLFIPLAREAMRRRREDTAKGSIAVSGGSARRGPVDVLVGLLAPAASVTSIIPILDTLGDRLGRLTLARVLTFESFRDEEDRNRAALELGCAELFLTDYGPSTVFVPGHPRTALVAHATEAGYDLLIIVRRSRRRRLSGAAPVLPEFTSPVPTLVVADAPRRE